jgi:lactoylglutathione lyase
MTRVHYPMFRVGDLERSIAFYARLGMKELRRRDVPEGKYTLAYLGWEESEESTAIGLIYNYDIKGYEHGSAYGQLVVEVPDVFSLCGALRTAGVRIKREPGPVNFGTAEIAFIEDPDGYTIELVQQKSVA